MYIFKETLKQHGFAYKEIIRVFLIAKNMNITSLVMNSDSKTFVQQLRIELVEFEEELQIYHSSRSNNMILFKDRDFALLERMKSMRV